MSTTRTEIPLTKVIDDLADTTLQVTNRLGLPIKEQQSIQEKIIQLARYIDTGFRISNNKNIAPGSAEDQQIKMIINEIEKPEAQLPLLTLNFNRVVSEIANNKHYFTDAQQKVEQIKKTLAYAKETEKSAEAKRLIENATSALTKLSTFLDNTNTILAQQENFKTKIPLLIAKITKDKAELFNILKYSSNSQPSSDYQQNIAMTLHGKPQEKAPADPKSAGKAEEKIQKGAKK